MALLSTIGTSDAESYVTVAEYHDYILKNYGIDITDGTLAKDEANLRRATSILDASWSWKGHPVKETQSREFPRDITQAINHRIVPNTTIPTAIKDAQCELAYAIKGGLDVTPKIEGGTIRSESVGAGSARVSTTFDEIYAMPKITVVETLIAPYHDGPSGVQSSEVIRG